MNYNITQQKNTINDFITNDDVYELNVSLKFVQWEGV